MSQPINYDGKMFRAMATPADAQPTLAHYHQSGDLVWAEFSGGTVQRGSLAGRCDPDGTLEFGYCMVDQGVVICGHCITVPERLPDGRLRLHEDWRRFTPDLDAGRSYLEEIRPPDSPADR